MPSGNLVVVDACVLINLEATGRLDAIARSLGVNLLVTDQARAEVGSLRAEIDGIVQIVPIQLERHIDLGTLTLTALESDELATYVELALELGDGEASSIAVAANRGISIATDDRKARRIIIERGLSEPIRTMGLLRAYCDRDESESAVIRELLEAVQQRASYVPPRSDPDYVWWRTQIGRDE